jgi:hypothetical protein
MHSVAAHDRKAEGTAPKPGVAGIHRRVGRCDYTLRGNLTLELSLKDTRDFYERTGKIPVRKTIKDMGYASLPRYIDQGFFKDEGINDFDDFLVKAGIDTGSDRKRWGSKSGLDEGRDIVRVFAEKHGRGPTIREAQMALGLKKLISYIEHGVFRDLGVQSYAGFLFYSKVSLKGVTTIYNSFWDTDEGFEQGTRRIREFAEKHGRSPMRVELSRSNQKYRAAAKAVGELDDPLFGLNTFYFSIESGRYRERGVENYHDFLSRNGLQMPLGSRR